MNMLNKKTILLVEDEALIAMSEKIKLEKYGFNVLTAHSGKDAINTFNNNKTDLVLMDIDLGSGIDGTEAAEIILKEKEIPIVFLSSHIEPEIVEKTEKITSYGYVVKNSGITILDASIKMAFKLFEEKQRIKKYEQELTVANMELQSVNEELEASYEEMEQTNEELAQTNEQLVESQEEILNRDEKLRVSEARFRNLYENSPYGIVICQLIKDDKDKAIDFIHLDGNHAATIQTGFGLEDIVGKKASEVGSPEEIAEPIKLYEQVVSTKKPANYIQYFPVYNRTIEVTAFHLFEDLFIINFYDITDRKRAENEREELLLETGERVKELRGLYGLTLAITECTDFKDLFRRTTLLIPPAWQYPEITRCRLVFDGQEYVSEPFKPARWKQTADIIVSGNQRGTIEVYYLEERPELDVGPFLTEERNLINGIASMLGTAIQRKQAEKALETSEENYRLMTEAMTDATYICSPDFRIEYMNPAMIKRTGRDATDESCHKVMHGFDKKCPWCIHEKIMKGEHINIEVVSPKDDKNYQISNSPIFHTDGSVSKLSVYHDLTKRMNAEKALQKALQANKDLLRELQHRAKNSFAMICSMINLAINASASDDATNVLSDIGSRIRAVSEMYDLLYISDSVTEVRLDEYLTKIISSLPNISGNITLKKTCDAVTSSVKTAIPVGIIIAELITNSIKHAFPDSIRGTITLSLKKNKTDAQLEVKDNGTGLPEKFDISSVDSLGLKLVNILVEQIDGSIKIKSKDGTRCIIKFPLEQNASG